MKPRVYIQLGRAGDILNVLPLLRRDHQRTGRRSVILVSEPYRDLLDGVTYVEPRVFRGPFEAINQAWPIAEKIAAEIEGEIICTQIHGDAISAQHRAWSFLRESWDQVPGAPPWGDLPLVFDRRDPSRAAGVRAQLTQRASGRPYIVTALSGTSSPLPMANELMRYLRAKLGSEFAIVDVSGYSAPRFYDLIGVIEGAHAVLAVDSGVLHLAHAAPHVPVVAFITRDPSRWHGTPWRPQHKARFFYDAAPECFADVVEELRSPGGRAPRIVHAVAEPPVDVDDETARRIDFATHNWAREYGNGIWTWPAMTENSSKRRTSSDSPINDERSAPFLRDVVDWAAEDAAPSDIIAWSNCDVSPAPGLTGQILDVVGSHGAAYTHRWDFHRALDKPFRSESEVVAGEWYPGSDAFFFTVEWWRKHRGEYPDMLLGREHVDEVMRQLVKRHGGLEIHGAIYHEKHPSFWDLNRATNPGNLHNRRLARKWFLRTGYGPNDPDWWQIPVSPV